MTTRRNRIRIGLPLYLHISPTWVQHFFQFTSQIAAYDKFTGLDVRQLPYIDVAMNQIVMAALADKNWDYLFSIEQDNIIAPGTLERIATLDPETHPIVGFLYFGKVADDMRPIPGFMRDNRLSRLEYDEVIPMLPQRGGVAGLHRVDTVGMGATAIHRSVFEKWPWTQRHPYFRTDYDDYGVLGHDVWFCVEAAKLGFPIHVDSTCIAKHIGEWKSDDTTYLNTTELRMRLAAEAAPKHPPGIVVPWVGPNGLRAQTLDAAAASGFEVKLVEMFGQDDYHNLIADLWHDRETFIVIEQDIVPHPGAIKELVECPQPWCAFAYDYPPFGQYAGMGCAKFGAALIAQFPDAMTETATWHDPKHPPKHWCRVDGWLKQYLMGNGVTQHVHGAVEHLHKGRPAHDCTTADEAAAIVEAQR